MWYQLTIDSCSEDQAHVLSDHFEEAGALSVTFTDKNDDPILEPPPGSMPLWPEITLQVLFDQEEEAQQAQTFLQKNYPHLQTSVAILADQDWQAALKQDFSPMCFGQRLWICPSWSTPPDPLALNLILDPGLAFGTGTHPTTALCLEWLDSQDLHEKTAIDFGCGSGILSLAALKLGATKVYAVDIDDQALSATLQNVHNNNFSEAQISISAPQALQARSDLIMANILLSPLIELKALFQSLLNPEGRIIVSGLLEEQIPLLLNEYHSLFVVQETRIKEGWAMVVFQRRD